MYLEIFAKSALRLAAAGAWTWLALGAPALAASPPDNQEPGFRYQISAETLPAPYATSTAFNPPEIIARPDGALPRVPQGFSVNVFAEGLDHPRWLAVAPNGDVFLAESDEGKVTVLRDADRDGKAEVTSTYITGLNKPHGLAFHGNALYIGDIRAIWRVPYRTGDLEAKTRKPVTRPGALGTAGFHWTRNIVFSPDGQSFFVEVGSLSNVGEDAVPHATVQRFKADGSNQKTFAAGLRNPVGVAFYPGTDNLYVVVNERDGLGDGLVPDYLTRIEEGQFFGWPYGYIGKHPDPEFGAARPDLVEKTATPDLLFESHSAPLGLAFYDATAFPAAYRGGAFVALHGSWNANTPTGYKVVFVPFENGAPKGHYENFMTGLWAAGETRARVWGRPAGLAVARDGSLLVADDTGGVVWRIAYVGE
jgi:glucose/arabinose dehydrogenase